MMRNRRAGLSLLEVLLTIFIISVGMLGVAALVPVGTYHASQAVRADRAAACAHGAFREIEARDMLRNEMWLWYSPMAQNSPTNQIWEWYGQYTQNPPVNELVPFMIDPLFVATNGNNAQNFTPPDRSRAQVGLFPCASYYEIGQMPRVTLRQFYYPTDPGSVGPMTLPLARRIFTWRDDVKFAPEEDDEGGRPQLTRPTSVISSQGDYSWMAMVTPNGSENAATPALPNGRLPASMKRSYLVSVIVFYKRDLQFNPQLGPFTSPAAQELEVVVPVVGNRVRLQASGVKLRPGQWILLSGLLQQQNQPPLPIHRWYRVVAASEMDEFAGRYEVTIAGPRWPDNSQLVRPPKDGLQQLLSFTMCTVVQDVVGVYEKSIEVDVNTLMSN